MKRRIRITLAALGAALLINLLPATPAAFAEEPKTPPSPAQVSSPTPSSQPAETPAVQPQTNQTSDARAMTPEEVQTYQTQSDSLAQSGQLQEMNVGATVNGTIVLSVLVALLIFAVLVAVL